jgi:hypothetical protein
MMRVCAFLTLGLCLLAGSAAAQPVGDDDDKIPAPGSGGGAAPTPGGKQWEEGVSEEDKQAARDLVREGNQLVKEYQWADAADKYRAALKLWSENPAINYNLAMALLNLDSPLELYKALTKAVKYGTEGMGGSQTKFDKAQTELEKAEKRLARVNISCKQPGVKVLLDGNQIFEGPGSYNDWVVAGSHTVKATKPGFLAITENRKLVSGEILELPIELMTAAQLTRFKRRWPVWQPWLVFGGGLLITGTAGFLHSMANTGFKEFDEGIVACGGCVPDDALASKKSGAETKQLLAFIGYGVGGAALITGSVLLYLNRAKSYRLDEDEPAGAAKRTEIGPWLAPDGAGVTASIRF